MQSVLNTVTYLIQCVILSLTKRYGGVMGKECIKERRVNTETFRYFTLYAVYNTQKTAYRNWRTVKYFKRRNHARKFVTR